MHTPLAVLYICPNLYRAFMYMHCMFIMQCPFRYAHLLIKMPHSTPRRNVWVKESLVPCGENSGLEGTLCLETVGPRLLPPSTIRFKCYSSSTHDLHREKRVQCIDADSNLPHTLSFWLWSYTAIC